MHVGYGSFQQGTKNMMQNKIREPLYSKPPPQPRKPLFVIFAPIRQAGHFQLQHQPTKPKASNTNAAAGILKNPQRLWIHDH